MLCLILMYLHYRQAWQSLGDMSKESAMAEFIKLVDSQCGLLKPYVEAHKAENLEQIRKQYVEILENTGQSEYLSFSM